VLDGAGGRTECGRQDGHQRALAGAIRTLNKRECAGLEPARNAPQRRRRPEEPGDPLDLDCLDGTSHVSSRADPARFEVRCETRSAGLPAPPTFSLAAFLDSHATMPAMFPSAL